MGSILASLSAAGSDSQLDPKRPPIITKNQANNKPRHASIIEQITASQREAKLLDKNIKEDKPGPSEATQWLEVTLICNILLLPESHQKSIFTINLTIIIILFFGWLMFSGVKCSRGEMVEYVCITNQCGESPFLCRKEC